MRKLYVVGGVCIVSGFVFSILADFTKWMPALKISFGSLAVYWGISIFLFIDRRRSHKLKYPIVAYKYLRVFPDCSLSSMVVSPVYWTRWKRDWNESFPSPNQSNWSGYYCFKRGGREEDWKLLRYEFEARVEICGKIVEHDDGYRAQYMRVTGICLQPYPGKNKEGVLNFASEYFGVPIVRAE